MTVTDYQQTIDVPVPASEVFPKINRVSDWWNRTLTGCSQQLGDSFRVNFGTTWVDFRIAEMVPNSRIVWEATDCSLPFLKDDKEWKDTQVVFELSPTNSSATRLTMTHVGLSPEVECFEMCEKGWNFYIGESLSQLLTTGQGLPDQRRG